MSSNERSFGWSDRHTLNDVSQPPSDGNAIQVYRALDRAGYLLRGNGALFALMALCGGAEGVAVLGVLLGWVVFTATAQTRPYQNWLGPMVQAAYVFAAGMTISLLQFTSIFPVVLGVWFGWWLLMWMFLRQVTRPGSQPRRVVDFAAGRFALILGVGALLCVGSFWFQLSIGVLLSLLTALTMLATVIPAQKEVLAQLWQLPDARPEEVVEQTRFRLKNDFDLEVTACAAGLRMSGALSGRPATVHLDLMKAPAILRITVALPEPLRALHIRARKEGEVGGVTLSDPLLQRLLVVEGVSSDIAASLLIDRHEEVLGVLHAWPGSVVRDGELCVEIEGPPFDPRRVGEPEAPQTPLWLAAFVSRRVAEVALLSSVLCAPIPPHRARHRAAREQALS